MSMALYAYFKKKENKSIDPLPVLPDANGPLTKVIPSSYITEANKGSSLIATNSRWRKETPIKAHAREES